jgi:hypothetical protein
VPSAKSIGTVRRIDPRQMVDSQLPKRMTAGKLMLRVSASKPAPSSGLIPATYMWCPQTRPDRIVTADIAPTVPLYQCAGLREKYDRRSAVTPHAGRMRM